MAVFYPAMILQTPWMTWPGAVPANVCDRICALGAAADSSDGGMTSVQSEAVRSSRVSWLSEQWLCELIFPYFQSANWSAGWLFHFQALERLQFTTYGEQDHYGWHVDQPPTPYGPEHGEYAGLYRKMSLSLQLSEPDSYDGGRLQIERGLPGQPDRIRTFTEILPRGSVIVFPSFLPHRITPITRGQRQALVAWVSGRPFL